MRTVSSILARIGAVCDSLLAILCLLWIVAVGCFLFALFSLLAFPALIVLHIAGHDLNKLF